jgi:hypothetical protein
VAVGGRYVAAPANPETSPPVSVGTSSQKLWARGEPTLGPATATVDQYTRALGSLAAKRKSYALGLSPGSRVQPTTRVHAMLSGSRLQMSRKYEP